MKKAVAAERVGETVPIESPVRASKSNGMMENAVKLWQEQLRTIKHDVESKFKRMIEKPEEFQDVPPLISPMTG